MINIKFGLLKKTKIYFNHHGYFSTMFLFFSLKDDLFFFLVTTTWLLNGHVPNLTNFEAKHLIVHMIPIETR